MAEARYRVAYALYRSGDSEAARREVLRALEVAPNYSDALDLLLTIRGTGASENFHGAGGHDA
jgi:Tfp pilus assembly protein PilF